MHLHPYVMQNEVAILPFHLLKYSQLLPEHLKYLITSAKEMAQGISSEARITAVFPPTIVGAIKEIIPNNGFSFGAIMETTPVGSRVEKLK